MNEQQAHPEHRTMRGVTPAVWGVAFPIHPHGILGWQTRRACHRRGGHWWHPTDAMIAWACCACGAERDGMPQDGSR